MRETSKPCPAPFLSRIRFTWYRNTTAESPGCGLVSPRHFSVSAQSYERTGPSTSRVVDRRESFFLSFFSLRSLLDSGNTFAILEDQLLRRCTHTISCVSDRYDFSLSLDWIFFFFGILSSFNFVKLILKTFLLFLDCVLRDRFDPFELLPDFIYPS